MNTAGTVTTPLHGMAAEFGSAKELYHAAEKMRDAGYRYWDVFSPFPIHGMDEAMGLKRSLLSKFVFVGGITGTTIACLLTFYPSTIEYPLIVAGKPVNFFTIPAFFPIMFELTILLSAFTATFGMLIMNGLPRWHHPMFNWDRFKKVTEDGFFLAIEARDPKFSENSARDMLEKLGGTNITLIHED